MVAVLDPATHIDWSALSHAYGSAADIPALLSLAETDTRGGHVSGSTWFDLWSALCHQGDSYSASYAAAPILIRLAELPAYAGRYDPLLLAASIEVARLEGRGPSLSDDLAERYCAAMRRGGELAAQALGQPLSIDSHRAFAGCVAAFSGDHRVARSIWDQED